MAVNPDPKPGRWILPLVVLGMIAFTYFFVRELPEASTETTLVSGSDTTTTTANNGDGGDGGTTTTVPSELDPETQAYLDTVDQISADLQAQRTELLTVNEGFNADPREIEYEDAETRFAAVDETTTALAEQLRGTTPPTALEGNHGTLQASLDTAAISASEALAGLRSTDTGERRNAAVAAFDQSATDFATEVTNTHNAAGG